MAEHWIVAPGVEGSIPFTHPTFELFSPSFSLWWFLGGEGGLFHLSGMQDSGFPPEMVKMLRFFARVAELADALDLGSSGQP